MRVKVTAQDYDGNRCRPRCMWSLRSETWDSVTRERSETTQASRDAATGADGTALVDLPVGSNGDFEITASARTRRTAPSKGKRGCGLEWLRRVVQPNAQAQIVADKKATRWEMLRICCWSPDSRSPGRL